MIIYAKNRKINSKASEASLAPQASYLLPQDFEKLEQIILAMKTKGMNH